MECQPFLRILLLRPRAQNGARRTGHVAPLVPALQRDREHARGRRRDTCSSRFWILWSTHVGHDGTGAVEIYHLGGGTSVSFVQRGCYRLCGYEGGVRKPIEPEWSEDGHRGTGGGEAKGLGCMGEIGSIEKGA